MSRQLKRRAVSLFLTLTLLFFEAPSAGALSTTRITEVGIENWKVVPEVTGSLSWQKTTLDNAKRVVARLERNLAKHISDFKAAGAVKIRVESKSPQWDEFWFNGTKNRWKSQRYVGLDAAGNTIAYTQWDPINNVFYARHLVRLSSTNCSLREVNLFDVTTWFEKKCGIVSTSPEWLLRLALEEYLAQGLRDLPRVVDYDLGRLDYALANRLNCKQVADKLRCENLGSLTGNAGKDEIDLVHEYGAWDYSISVDLKKRSAVIKYISPRPKLFAQLNNLRLSDLLASSAQAEELIFTSR